MESHQLLDPDKQHSAAIGQNIHVRFWLYFIDALRWILCTLSERVTALELWALGSDESHKQAESRNAKTIFIRIDSKDGDAFYCQALLDTGSGLNLISTSRVSELGLSYEAITKEEEEDATLTDLDHTESHPLGSLKIDYRGGHHGHSPQSVEASKFYVLDDVPYGILLGRHALNDLHVFTLDPLYFSRPPRRTPKERILTVPGGERWKRGTYFIGQRKGIPPSAKAFFPDKSKPPPPVTTVKR